MRELLPHLDSELLPEDTEWSENFSLSRLIFPVHRFRQLPPELCRTVENKTKNRPLQFRMYPVPVGEGLAFPLGKNGTCSGKEIHCEP